MSITRSKSSFSLIVALWTAIAAAYLPLTFNTTHTYGPDGPWYGVQVTVAYVADGAKPYSVSLLPALFNSEDGVGPAAYVPIRRVCNEYPGSDCGVGGVIPTPASDVKFYFTMWNSFIDPTAAWYSNISGPLTKTRLQLSNTFEISGAFVAVANKSYVSYPSLRTTGLELGYLSLGSGVTWDDELDPFLDPPYYALNQSLTQSSTWNYHAGAASLGYPGSLVFGGYDRGRAIGPALAFNADDGGLVLPLSDVMIGVEVGDSPFSFDEQASLLDLGSGPVTSSYPAQIWPQFPYIGLPQATVSKITELLPVSLNAQVGYYLWDTASTDYAKITSSPAYLGFVFSDPSSDGGNVTIKVPFRLLSLTLEPAASGLDHDVSYLPLLATDTIDNNPLVFGRAFLQAAYIGGNWASNSSWIAQAVGPGVANEGLGTDLKDLPATTTTLDLQSGDALFQNSWSGHWTVSDSGGSSGSGPAQSTSSSSGLSGGAIAGIVVGVVAALAIIAAIIFFKRKRSKSSNVKELSYTGAQNTEEKSQFAVSELSSPVTYRWSEVENKEERRELPATRPIHELPGN